MPRPPLATRVLLSAACLLVAAPASHAATVTFGANLDAIQQPNSDPAKTCSAGAWWYAEQGVFLNPVPTAARGSCQFTASGFFNGQVFGLAAPASGTVTAARVKVGAITGPMRVNVVRTLFQQTGSVANPAVTTPFLQAYGPTFTPRANAVTTVPLNLAVRSQATPDPSDTTTVAGTDWLALEILAPDVPVPLVPYPNGTFFAAFPGPTAGNVPAPSPNALPNFGQLGYVVAMNADLETGGTPVPAVALSGATARVSRGRAVIALACRGAACAGSVTLRRGAVCLGSARLAGPAGRTLRVSVPLNAQGRRLTARTPRAAVQAVVRLTGAPSPTTLSLTLRR
ncbi:MAG: hypothetical protein MUE51_14600 [Thermoleophilia bacterium]|nr:hypothetical protein [Thermoleophilia bacterium]